MGAIEIQMDKRNSEKLEITLALGGGGARGLAHLGIIEVLIEQGYSIRRIVGVSMGSLVGAMVATGDEPAKIRKKALHYLLSERFKKHQQALFGMGSSSADQSSGYFSWYYRIEEFLKANRLFRRIVTQPGMLPGILLEDVMKNLVEEKNIEQLPIPLSVVAVDLVSGHQVILEHGPLREAVRGSSSLPGIFPPVPFDEMQLCDTGTFCSLPARIARSYGHVPVVAVEVSSDVVPGIRCHTALDVLMRVDEIGENYWRKQVRHRADLLIRPNVSQVPWYDFTAAEYLFDLGRKAAQQAMSQIEKLFEQ